jgi:GrpB-like predicted nucleotidyltransferase (UPF0157 family)/GNAT superfamily N-acetyltransferase
MITIERARRENLAALPGIERDAAELFRGVAVAANALEEQTTDDEFAAAFQRGHLWVAREAGAVVGFALVELVGGEPHLDELDVLRSHGRRGIGRLLVFTVRRWAEDAGYRGVTLTTFRDVPWNEPFYERCGFEVVPDAELGPELRAQVKDEATRGLDPATRVVMRCAFEPLESRIARSVREEVALAPYDPRWPESFRREKAHLEACLPSDLVRRVEHFGSTAVSGLAAKPIVDILVEVADLQATRERIAPVLESQGYDYFWRPTMGNDPPFYAWFIKRDPATGVRTHHIHMVENTPEFAGHWVRLLFRDYLIAHPERAREYAELKTRLAASEHDRVAYTAGKTEFVLRITELAKRHYAP